MADFSELVATAGSVTNNEPHHGTRVRARDMEYRTLRGGPMVFVAIVATLALTACGSSSASSPGGPTTTTSPTPAPTTATATTYAPPPAPSTAATTQAADTINAIDAQFTDGPNGSGATLKDVLDSFPYQFDIPASFKYVDAGTSGEVDTSLKAYQFDFCTATTYVLLKDGGACVPGNNADLITITINNNISPEDYVLGPNDIAVTPPTTVNVSFDRGPAAKLDDSLALWSKTDIEYYSAQFFFRDKQQNTVEIDASSLSRETAEAVLSQIIVKGKLGA